ncbi:hypothetical protein ACFE04_022885 [Oxalis oulophora]
MTIPITSVIHPTYEDFVPREGMPSQKDLSRKENLRNKFNIMFSTKLNYEQKGSLSKTESRRVKLVFECVKANLYECPLEVWKVSAREMIKLNFDASFLGPRKNSYYDVVARNCEGEAVPVDAVSTHLLSLINNNSNSNSSTNPPPQIPEYTQSSNLSGILAVGPGGGLMKIPSYKQPKGRVLIGENVVYDIDVRLPNELQPQLEVTPITKYTSDPLLSVGRQIAVNKVYICYGLRQGNIRVLNINNASRSLLRGHAQRVSDMAFFAEDVHLLASVSVEGRVNVWKISDGQDEEEKPQIIGNITIAIQIVGEKESAHPRVCWYCHKQEVLVVAIGRRVFKIDTTKVGQGQTCTAETPLQCPVDKLIDGVQLIGEHDGEVTDISMCQWMITRLVSASTDGVVKIWDDRNAQPLAVFKPHDGQPVYAASFMVAPTMPSHVLLLTAGPLNREVKIWSSASEEGWLLPSDTDAWKCTQTLELKSSAKSRHEDAFFNQLVALPQAGFFLLANAKKNAIYVVHIEYGSNPAASRMDYIAEFTVTMPILSFTASSNDKIKVYCVQTQAIQEYALQLSQCLPSEAESVFLERSGSNLSLEAKNTEGILAVDPRGTKPNEVGPTGSGEVSLIRELIAPNTVSAILARGASGTDVVCVSSSPLLQSPRLTRKSSGFRNAPNSFEPSPGFSDHDVNQPAIDYSVDRQMNNELRNDDNNISLAINPPTPYQNPTHLVTPSEILMSASSSDIATVDDSKTEGASVHGDMGNAELEVKVVGKTRPDQMAEVVVSGVSQIPVPENREKSFCSQASDLGIEIARECSGISAEEAQQIDGFGESEQNPQTILSEEDIHDPSKSVSGLIPESALPSNLQQSATASTKGRKQKGRNSQGLGLTSSSQSAFASTDSFNEPGGNSSYALMETAFSQNTAMLESLNQLMTMHKEMQKQFSNMVMLPVNKECRKLETSLGRNIEKAMKVNNDALWARFQEENARNERLSQDRTQQIINSISNLISKDLPAMVEKTVKKELTALGPALIRSLAPANEKTISSAITESFQRGVSDKAVNQLEKSVNSKLEATVARQIQAQFQTSGKHAIQDALKTCMEASMIPAFEMSCKAMFDQVDNTFQKGITEHTTAAQQHFEAAHTPLALSLRDVINSASSVVQTLSGELADGQRKLFAAAAARANQSTVNPLVSQLSNGSLAALHEKVEASLDPTKELSRLLSNHKYEEAFTVALQRSDLSIVSWLCSQVDLHSILSMVPVPLSQGVLLSLLQQLACDINKDASKKLTWMTDVAAAINPADQMIAVHVRPIFEQVSQILHHQRNSSSMAGPELSSARLLMHVINSMLMTCK